MRELSKRVKAVKPSPTLAITAKAKALKAQGVDLVDFAAGEPDWDTPVFIKQATIKALEEGFTKYTPSAGILELREVICEKLMKENGLTYTPNEVIVTVGGKQALYNLFMALFDEGDEVIIPSPYWVSYIAMALLCGARPVVVDTENSGFKLTPEDLKRAITPKTKALVINTPCNPTGIVYSEKELASLAEVALDKDLWIISDEVYEHLVYDDVKHCSIASLSPEVKERTVVVNALSKTYCMTGWRVGFAAGPREVILAMEVIQSQSTSNVTSFVQKGALSAFRGSHDFVKALREEFQKRRDLIYELVVSRLGIKCVKPSGAFYLFPDFRSFLGKTLRDDQELCEYLLEKARVATIPGSEFGKKGFLRLSFCTPEKAIREGIDRIKQALEELV